MYNRQDPRATFAALAVAACGAALVAGCGRPADIRPGDIRTYTVARTAATAPDAAAPAAAPRETAGLRYAVPAAGSPIAERPACGWPRSRSATRPRATR